MLGNISYSLYRVEQVSALDANIFSAMSYDEQRRGYWRTVMNDGMCENDYMGWRIVGARSKWDECNQDSVQSSLLDEEQNIDDDGFTSDDVKKRSFPCSLCSKKFRQSSNQKKHIRQVHWKLKPYRCQDRNCKKMFAQKSVAFTHFTTVHMGCRPYSCPLCTKTFSDKSNMRKHVRNLHLKHKPYVCGECGNKFGEKRSLNDHINCVHLKQKPYECPVVQCARKFGQKTHMSKHIKTKHSDHQ